MVDINQKYKKFELIKKYLEDITDRKEDTKGKN